MIIFIDERRSEYGGESICRVIKIVPSTYHKHTHRRTHPGTAPPRVKFDAEPMPKTQRVFDENFQAYGYNKAWRQLKREGIKVARCTVVRLMKTMSLAGVICGEGGRSMVVGVAEIEAAQPLEFGRDLYASSCLSPDYGNGFGTGSGGW